MCSASRSIQLYVTVLTFLSSKVGQIRRGAAPGGECPSPCVLSKGERFQNQIFPSPFRILVLRAQGLKRYYGAADLHFISCRCYQRKSELGTTQRRDLFLEIACDPFELTLRAEAIDREP